MRKKDIFEENKELQSSLFLAQSYQDAWADYGRSLKKERFARWDYVVLTASNEEQAEGFREQIKLRNDEGFLPIQTKFLILPDPEGKRVGSGGATLNLLRAIAEEENSGDFSEQRILVIHSGGDSKRVPQYSALEKVIREGGTLKDKKVLIIGATGKIGGIVLMNLESLHQADIYVTTRKNKLINTKHGNDDFTTIDYEDRYNYLDQMDVVISATSSPHYTLTYSKMKKQLVTAKRRVFVDLAVPMDIEAKISAVDDTCYYNIDDFTRIAKENNQKKLREAEAASGILDEYELQFEQWMVFQKSLSVMGKVRDNFVKVAEHKGVEKAFDHFFYWVRENNTPEDLETFFHCLNH